MTEPKIYTREDSEMIFFGDHLDFDQDEVAEIKKGSGRWRKYFTKIFRHTESGELWAVDGGVGLTEMQDNEFNSAPYPVQFQVVEVPATTRVIWSTLDGKEIKDPWRSE